jgi:hypothetical protein
LFSEWLGTFFLVLVAAGGGVINKWVSITYDQAEYIFHLQGACSNEIETFRNMIINQMQKAKTAATNANAPHQLFKKK